MKMSLIIYRFVFFTVFATLLFLVVYMPLTAQVKSSSSLILEDETLNQGTHVFTNCGDIISPGSENKPFVITGDAQVTFSSGTAIHLKPGFRASDFSGNGYFRTSVQLQAAIIEPGGDVGKFEKLEIGLQLPEDVQKAIDRFFETDFTNGINPYNPEYLTENGISVEACFTSPSGITKRVFGFFYRDYEIVNDNPTNITGETITYIHKYWAENPTDYHFRIRFAPDETGAWSGVIKVFSSEGTKYAQTCISFNCIPSENKGYLEAGNNNYLRFSDTHESFFAIGENIAWPNEYKDGYFWSCYEEYEQQMNFINELDAHDGNYVRFVLAPWGPIVEWEKLGVYDKGVQNDNVNLIPMNRQMHLWMLDKAFDIAHENDMYIHLCGEVHEQFQNFDTGGFGYRMRWPSNPYNSANQNTISGVNDPKDFFANQECRAYYKKRLRYFLARWGYSTNLAVYELLSEIDQMGNVARGDLIADPLARSELLEWHIEMAEYLKNDLGAKQMISTCFAGFGATAYNNYFYNDINLAPNIGNTSAHYYGYVRNINFRRQSLAKSFLNNYNKPFIYGEIGGVSCIEQCTDMFLHNNLWATTFMGGFGVGLNWNWQQHHQAGTDLFGNNYFENYSSLYNFIKDVDFQNYQFVSGKYSEGSNSSEINDLKLHPSAKLTTPWLM